MSQTIGNVFIWKTEKLNFFDTTDWTEQEKDGKKIDGPVNKSYWDASKLMLIFFFSDLSDIKH